MRTEIQNVLEDENPDTKPYHATDRPRKQAVYGPRVVTGATWTLSGRR